MSGHILIVEDEPQLALLMADYVRAAGHAALVLDDGAAALAAIRSDPPLLAVLDVMLPGMDGLALCRAVRGFSNLPIIMVTARVEEIDRLLGLEAGADDYLCKPFSPRELVARIKAILRRAAPAPSMPLQLDQDSLRAAWHGEALELTPTEFAILAALARHPGQVLSRAQLLDAARSDKLDVLDRAIDSHIKNLRRKLAQVTPDLEPIRSIYGVGYRLET